MHIRTPRLLLREMTQEDFPALCRIMQDPAVMTPVYGAPFTANEVQRWLERQLARYSTPGHGLMAVVLAETGAMIGQCGLTLQPWRGDQVLEVGYLFARDAWGRGYATEAAGACIAHAFSQLNAPSVHAIIPDFNAASRRVAERNGMRPADSDTHIFRGREMTFIRYDIHR